MLFACKKDSGLPNDSTSSKFYFAKNSEDLVDVVDGILTFVDMATFDSFLTSILESSDSLRLQFESEIGFTSYASIIDSLTEVAITAQNESEMLQVINVNSQYLTIIDSTLVAQLPFDGYLYVANADGIFKIDSTYYKVTNTAIVAWRGATLNEIETLDVDEDFEENLDEGLFYFLKTDEMNESGCGNSIQVTKNNSSNNRRIEFKLWVWINGEQYLICPNTGYLNTYRRYKFSISIKGQKKVLGIWFDYKTNLEFKEVFCELNVPVQSSFNSQTCTSVVSYINGGVYNQSGSQSNTKLLLIGFSGYQDGLGHDISNQVITDPVFIKVKGKASSTGLGSSWAEVSCGY